MSTDFALRPVTEADLPLLHRWHNDPVVDRYWELAGPVDRVAAHLAGLPAHARPMIGELAGAPISYWELYRADLDPLAAHYPAAPHDAGIHLLLGPAEVRGRGLGARLIGVVADGLLAADPEATRVVAEPDVRNVASVRAFERAGFVRAAEVHLPDKTAALMIKDRT